MYRFYGAVVRSDAVLASAGNLVPIEGARGSEVRVRGRSSPPDCPEKKTCGCISLGLGPGIELLAGDCRAQC